MFEGFVEWLSGTELTAVLSDTTTFWTWLIIPLSQCIHIVCVAIVMMSVGLLNLRLLGLAATQQSFAQLVKHLMPWIWSALTLLFLTGAIQTAAEPARELLNIGFRTKMVLLFCTVLITMFYESTVKRDPNYWSSPKRRNLGHVLAAVSIVFWIGIVTAGRMIAYLGFDQEQ
jgi:hypothetical protein